MNPGLDYEKLKQESDEIDGLKGMRTLDVKRSSFDHLTGCGDLITNLVIFFRDRIPIKSQRSKKE